MRIAVPVVCNAASAGLTKAVLDITGTVMFIFMYYFLCLENVSR